MTDPRSKTATASDTNLAANNIKSGVNIFGVNGSVIEASGDATAADVLSGKTFSNAGAAGIAGAMPDRGAVNITPGTSAQAIAAGYHNGSGQVAGDADLVAGNIKSGVTLFGVAGTLSPGALAKRVAKTGQTQCWDASGGSIPCAGTGQDGQYQAGVADYVVAPTCSPDCTTTGAYNTPAWTGVRFTDNGDGTVTDNLTALIWLKNANCFGMQTWANALSAANTLASGSCGLSDGSVAGAWRLPNVNELHSLGPTWPPGAPFSGVRSGSYWSGTTDAGDTSDAWSVYLNDGLVGTIPKSLLYYVWPVRGGQ